MSKLDTQPYKGVRDFYPEDQRVENYIFNTWRKVAKEFKFEEYSASPLEPKELYTNKTSEEIVNEQMFTFTDRGDREVALRPEMTPTLARMVAGRRKSLKFPLRWFSIPNVFRYERPQRGRKREHYQLNCDLLGVSDVSAEVEILSLAHAIMKAFGARDEDFLIKINDRKALPQDKELLRKVDKGEEKINIEQTKDVEEVLSRVNFKNIVFDPNIVRGFDYYTGIVFEIFDTNTENSRSLFGGGRYDNLLEIFDVEPVPAVGFGMGDITIRDFLETHGLLKDIDA